MGRYLDLSGSNGVDSQITGPETVDQNSARKAWGTMKGSQKAVVSDTHKFCYIDQDDVADPDDEDERSIKSVSVYDRDTDPDEDDAINLGEFDLVNAEQGFSVEQNALIQDARILTAEAINAFLAEIAGSKPEDAPQLTPEMEALAKRLMDEVK